MRLTSGFFVSALLRRVSVEGGFGAIMRRGAEEAGAIYVIARGRGGIMRLYRPAPQAAYGESRSGDRLFVADAATDDGTAVDQALAREARFDSDLWIVEIETPDADAAAFLSVTTP